MILKNILKKKVNNKDKKKSMRVGVELLYKILKCTEKLIIKGMILPPDTGSKLGKEYVKAVYCHPAYLIYMQSASWEMLGWKKHVSTFAPSIGHETMGPDAIILVFFF